jgi:hypothetical protein
LLALAAFLPGGTLAWGPQGHRVAGLLAEQHLCQEARATIRELWPRGGLPAAGLWPDEIRGQSRWDHARPWHYINVPDSGPWPPADRSPEGDVLWAIDHFSAILSSGEQGQRQRREALAFLTHFVADLHQPLHVGRAEDRGGNDIRIRGPDGRELNLHGYWDTSAITAVQSDPRRYAATIAPLAVGHADFWQSTEPLAWARESLTLRPVVYDFHPAHGPVTLDADYAEQAQTTARLRLAQAGVRIAGLLNELLGAGADGCSPPELAR